MAARPGRGPVRPYRKDARRDGTLEYMGRERDRPRGADHPAEAPDLDHERLLADYDAAMEVALAEIEHAFLVADGDWPERMRAGIARLLQLAARNPKQTRLCTIDVFAAGAAGLVRRDQWLGRFARLCDAGLAAGGEGAGGERPGGERSGDGCSGDGRPGGERPSEGRRSGPSRLAAPLATGALFELIRSHAAEGRLDRLENALPTALLIVLGPAVGRDAALRLAG